MRITRIYSIICRALSRKINRLRVMHLKLQGAHVGARVKVHGRISMVGDPVNFFIGKGSTINEGAFLNLRGSIKIGCRVHISPYVQIHTGTLTLNSNPKTHQCADVKIDDDVWIASGAIILSGVSVGAYSVVAANSVVTKDIPPGVLVAGSPAKVIRYLDLPRIRSL